MKKILSFILMIFASLSSPAQKIRFSDSTNRWTYYYFSSGIIPPFVMGPYADYYNHDTVVDGKKYRQLRHHSFDKYVLVREDTVLRKVFAIIPFHDTDTTEKILYDYTLSVGDTLRIPGGTYRVDSIDSVMINGLWYKIWYFGFYSGSSPLGFFSIIEGLGSNIDPCLPIAPPPGTFEGYDLLTCFQNEGVTPAISPPVGPYLTDLLSYPLYFDNTSSCGFYPLELESKTGPIHSITLYPNPAHTELMVTAGYRINTITISNLVGQISLLRTCNSQSVQLDIVNFPAGVYFLRINGSDVRKFVKE